MDVSPSSAIDARCSTLAADYYRLAGKSGTAPLSAEGCCTTARVSTGSDDPAAGCRGPRTRLLRRCAGHRRRLRRFQLRHFPADGDYLIEVRDVNYDGGREPTSTACGLAIFPLITSVSPLGGRQGSTMAFNIEAAAAEMLGGDVSLAVPGDRLRAWINVKYPRGALARDSFRSCAPIWMNALKPNPTIHPRPRTRSAFPAPSPGISTNPASPLTSNSRPGKASKFPSAAWRKLIGSRAVLSLQVLAADGTKIAPSQKADGPDDAALEPHRFPRREFIDIVARELAGSAGPGMFYRLEIREVKPGFSLAVDTDVINAGGWAIVQDFRDPASRRNFTWGRSRCR